MTTATNTNRAARILSRCRDLAACTESPGETTRTFLSPPMHVVHNKLRDWMQAAGMSVHIDAAGNLRSLYPGVSLDAPRLLIGSHLDTVPNAGPYDGILGVLLGLALVEELDSKHLPIAIEVIGFSEEEGVRFKTPFLGSLALTGGLTSAHLDLADPTGTTLAKAIRDFGLNPTDLPAARLASESVAYIEFHIEQGPILDSESLSLGIVESLVGQSRLLLTFTGAANHAGTTPMHLRHDAMAAAAEWIVAVECLALQTPGLIATAGSVTTRPGAGNIIAGEVTVTLDLRHANDNTRTTALASLLQSAHQSAAQRGVHLASHQTVDQPAVPLDAHLIQRLQTTAASIGLTPRLMVSGAGHDAMVLAPHLPSVMVFLRTPRGISHHPDETVLPEDIEAALTIGLALLQSWDTSKLSEA